MVVVPMMKFELPEIPDKDYQLHEANNRRINKFYKTHPHGHIEILPSPFEVYEYHKIDRKNKIVFQIIRESDDASFLEGNYREYLTFYWCKKIPVMFPIFPWEWFKKEWSVRYEIPIEMIEEEFEIPFRDQWKRADEYRHKYFEERMKNENISRHFIPII